MNTSEIKIADAQPDDARDIINVLRETWLATYPNEELGITKEDIEESFKESLTEEGVERLRNKIANVPPNNRRLVAKQGKRIVGIARVVKNDDNNKIETIYVLPEYQGRGVGKMLWEEMKKFSDPTKDTVVDVAIYNENAIEFYKKYGFIDTGKRFSDNMWRLKKVGASMPEMEMIIKAK